MKPSRQSFVAEALSCLDVHYLWGGKDLRGLDCSGHVTWCLSVLGGEDLRADWNTDTMWNKLPAPLDGMPKPGDLALYGGKRPNDVSHVAVLVARRSVGAWVVVTAAGGDSTVTSLSIARQKGARVKMRLTHLYRDDFRGFRSMAQFLAEQANP